MNLDEFKESSAPTVEVAESENDTKSFKKEKNRFEFALFINDFLVCKRNFPINGFVEKSMQTSEFKSEVDRIVELIDEDLKSKTRVYTHYHFPQFTAIEGDKKVHFTAPEWEPEMMTETLIEEGTSVLKFAVFDDGREVISKTWDARFYPTYVRKNIDLTNRQVKITKGEKTNIYDKETFFADNGSQIYGDLYVLKNMISDKEDLIPAIQKLIYEVCSSFDGYYEKIADYHTVEEYRNCDIKRDADGKPMYKQKTQIGPDGEEYGVLDAFGNPWMVPVLDRSKKGKKYNLNIDAYNKKIDSMWGAAVGEKTRKYMSELYVSPKEKFYKKKEN